MPMPARDRIKGITQWITAHTNAMKVMYFAPSPVNWNILYAIVFKSIVCSCFKFMQVIIRDA